MMGQSGGRSRKHRTGHGAAGRATQRERSFVDPPRGSDTEWEKMALEDLPDLKRGISDDIWVSSLILVGGIGLLTGCLVFALWIGQLLGIIK